MTHLGGVPQMNLMVPSIVIHVKTIHCLSTWAIGVRCVSMQELTLPRVGIPPTCFAL